jgi:hypothetical protein
VATIEILARLARATASPYTLPLLESQTWKSALPDDLEPPAKGGIGVTVGDEKRTSSLRLGVAVGVGVTQSLRTVS